MFFSKIKSQNSQENSPNQNSSLNAKDAIEQQYTKERTAGAQNPAPKNPDAPYPIVSDQSAPDKVETYRNDTFGFSFTYQTYQLDRLDGQISTDVLTDSTSTLSYGLVAGDPLVIFLYDDPTKLKVRGYDPGTDDYDLVTYLPTERKWLVTIAPSRGPNYGSPKPLCPEEQFTKTGLPYYFIATGIHAGDDVTVFITTKGLVAFGGYDANQDSIFFDNPQSVLTATCKVMN